MGRRNIVESRYTVISDKHHMKRASHRKGRGLARHVIDLAMIVSAYNLETIRTWSLTHFSGHLE